MKQFEMLPQVQRQRSFDRILEFYQTRHNKKFLIGPSLSCRDGLPQRKLQNSPIMYNMAINSYTPRNTMKTNRKQTVRTIYLDKKNSSHFIAKKSQKKEINLTEIKQKMKQRINYFSVKNEYDQLMKIAADQQLVDRLKSELVSLPKPVKYSPKSRRVSHLIQSNGEQFKIQGSKMKQSSRLQKLKILVNKTQNNNAQNNLSFMNKSSVSQSTDFKVRKYRKSDGQTVLSKVRGMQWFNMEQLQASPLTGWG